MPVEASWFGSNGTAFKRTATTMLVSKNGGVLRLTERLAAGQELTLRRQQDGDVWKSARARANCRSDGANNAAHPTPRCAASKRRRAYR